MANHGIRTARRRRDYVVWCEKAKAIDAAMAKRHEAAPLTARAIFRLALRLKHEHEIFRMVRAIDGEPSGKAIKRHLGEIQKSIERLADFARDVEAADQASIEQRPIAADLWERRGALRAIERAGQRWEMAERKKHRQLLEAWVGSTDRITRERPRSRLEGHIEPPRVMGDGSVIPYADVMVRQWFEQARFIKEILKEPSIAVRHIDELDWPSAQANLVGVRVPNLFEKTYPGLRFGSRSRDQSFDRAPGYTFAAECVLAITGQSISAETIRTHKRNAEKRRVG